MSMISEQVNYLRVISSVMQDKDWKNAVSQSADTIEALSAKLAAANMERSDRYYGGGWIPVSVRPPEEKTRIDEETGYYGQSDNVLCRCFDECEGKYEIWIDYTVDGYWQTHEYCEGENLEWMPLPETYLEEIDKRENKEVKYDKIMRVSEFLIQKYGDKLWEEFGVEKTGDAFKDIPSILKIFDEIYKREKEKYPLMWYEYCLCGNSNLE